MCASEEARPKKKARKHKEYIPGVGTAAYAFLITLFKVLLGTIARSHS